MQSELLFSYIMARKSYMLMRWWRCLLCNRPKWGVGILYC